LARFSIDAFIARCSSRRLGVLDDVVDEDVIMMPSLLSVVDDAVLRPWSTTPSLCLWSTTLRLMS